MALTEFTVIPQTTSPSTFASDMDTWLSELDTWTTEANSMADEINTAQGVCLDATSGLSATKWVSGTTYAEGDTVWSPTDYLVYRRKTNGAGTTDPTSDTTNWILVAGTGNVRTDSTQTLTNKTLTAPTVSDPVFTGAIQEGIYDLSGTSPRALDPANGTIQTITLTANTTLTDSLVNGESMVLLIDDGASAYTITFPSTTWIDSTSPTLPATGYAWCVLSKIGGTLYGIYLGDS